MRARTLCTLVLLLFLVAACSDGSGGTRPIANFDRTAAFLEAAAGQSEVLDAADSSDEDAFLGDNPIVEALLDQLASVPYFAKPSAMNSTELRRQIQESPAASMKKGIPSGPAADPGTYVYSESEEMWVIDDPESPTDSSLFLIRESDNMTIGDPALVVEGEVQYWFESRIDEPAQIELVVVVEVRVAPVGSPLETIIRLHDRWYGEEALDHRILGVERGDNAAADRVSSDAASWIGDFMVHANVSQEITLEASNETSLFGISIQYYERASQGMVFVSLGQESITPTAGNGDDGIQIGHVGAGFGTTAQPADIPWLMLVDVREDLDPEEVDGEIRYHGRKVGTIDGTTEPVSCETCEPPQTCEDIWVTWSNDKDNPVLFCELTDGLLLP